MRTAATVRSGDTSSTPPPYTLAGLADDAFQLLQALGIHRTHWVGQAMGGLDLNQRIQEIKCPTLVMVGAHDPATPVEMARRIHSQITHSSLVVLPDASHMANLEQPEQFNHHVLTFLASL